MGKILGEMDKEWIGLQAVAVCDVGCHMTIIFSPFFTRVVCDMEKTCDLWHFVNSADIK